MANVTVQKDRYTVDPLYQWDLNQVLEIRGLSLPSIPEIHFTNDAMDRAIVKQASMDDTGVITVDVPNSLLQKPYKITAYVCIYEGESFQSLYSITILVKARNKPNDYTLEGDSEVYSFNAIENYVNNTVANLIAMNDEASKNLDAKFTRLNGEFDNKYNTLLDTVDTHSERTDNPHGVTCDQIGAVLREDFNCDMIGAVSWDVFATEVDAMLEMNGVYGHINKTNNPHQVTAKQIGAVTTEELNERLSNLGGGSSAEVTEHINDTDNPHNVTCAKIGAVPVEEIGLYVNDIVVNDINGDGDISNAIGPLIGTEVQSTLEQQNLLTHAFDNENPHNVTASQIGAVTTAELANTKTIFNNKAIDTAYAYREGIYSDFLTSVHYPDESFLMEKYLGGTFKVVWTAVHYTSYTTSEAMEVCIPVPFKVKSHNITIDNYSDYCHTLEVVPGTTSSIDTNNGIYAFWVDIGADAPEEGAESNLLDFTITITGTWE